MHAARCAALLAAVAAVQVQMVLAQLSKKTVSWFAAGARYRPGGEGVVVWVTRGALTPRKQVEYRAPIGQMPPNLAKMVLDQAILDRSVAAATAQQERAEHLLGQMPGPWEEAKKRRLLKAPLAKMPPCTLPPFGKWEVTGGHQEEPLHGVVFAGHSGGWEVYDLAGTAVSRSCTQKLRERGVSVRMHTAPDSSNRRNCMYVAVKVILWHMSHRVSVWGNPPALSHFSMWGRQCRELMGKTLARAQVKGNWKCRRTSWGPQVLKEMKEVSGQLAPVGGGKGPVPFAALSGNMVPIVVLFCIANPDSGPVIPGVGKGKEGGEGGGVIQTLQTLLHRLQWGRGRRRRRVRGRGRGG